MAELCLKCFVNKVLSDNDLTKIRDVQMSEHNDFCEGCGRWTLYVEKVSYNSDEQEGR